ncbi:MAG TPA: ankyrin repeat domain-containing protein, partial [Myxococcota bacterium]|nr:ankyrin repeat domain-containing protein [Myxococcota bacterium]
LGRAAARGNLDALAYLLELGVEPAPRPGQAMMTAAHEAAYFGKRDALEVLRLAGRSLTTPDERGVTPLALAMENGHVELARWILSRSAEAAAETYRAHSPLRLALRWCPDHVGSFAALLPDSAFTALVSQRDGGKASPYDCAAAGEGPALAQLLACDKDARVHLHAGLDVADGDPIPLDFAIHANRVANITRLLPLTPDVYFAAEGLPTGLVSALENRHLEAVERIAQDPRGRACLQRHSASVLAFAIASGATELTRLLLRHLGSEARQEPREGACNVLHWAAESESLRMVELVLKHVGKSLGKRLAAARDEEGLTPAQVPLAPGVRRRLKGLHT